MSLFKWDESYSVKNKEIDNQHKKLGEIINELYDAMHEGNSRQELCSIFRSLIENTRTHFSFEEKFMENLNFENLSEHKKEHIRLEQKAKEYYYLYESKRIALTIEFMEFLLDWLLEHIISEDKEYAKLLSA